MNIQAMISKAKFVAGKHSPEILLGVGLVGVVASTVMACRATTKAKKLLEEHQENLDIIKNTEIGEEYSEDDQKKDLTIQYTHTAVGFVKLYAPSVILGTASIMSILASHGILKKRNAALAAAYAAVDQGFKDYRKRVVERFGKGVDEQLKYGLKAETIEEKTTDEKGKEKIVKKDIYVADPNASGYVKYFTRTNPYWDNDKNRRELFFKTQMSIANDKLYAFKHVTLNDVYKMLGFEDTKPGMVVGWILDRNNKIGDNYIEFDIKEVYLPNEFGGHELAYAIDFNVDGNIYDRL